MRATASDADFDNFHAATITGFTFAPKDVGEFEVRAAATFGVNVIFVG
jgi:hypothetical protein